LEVFKKQGRYAVKVEVTSSSRQGQQGYAQNGDVQWVDLDPELPFLQIFDDKTGAVHDLGQALASAEKGGDFEIPRSVEEQKVDAVTAAELEHASPGKDDPGAEPSAPNVVRTEAEIPEATDLQSPLPGTTLRPTPPTISPEHELPAATGFCEMPIEDERVNATNCPDQPSQRVNGHWRSCPDRDPSPIERQGDSSYSNWLVDLVNAASAEVAMSPVGQGSSCASPALIMSLMDQESTFNPMAGGNSWGDHGIAQFQLATAQDTVKYLRRVAAAVSPMKDLILKPEGLLWMPPGCQKTSMPWKNTLSASCQRSIETSCVQEGRLVASLYCPQFAVRLQAYHIKQICEEDVEIDGVNVTQVLQGNGDPVAQARFVVSRYNRGMRVYNSAAHFKAQYGRFPTAHEYGELWDTRRPMAYARRTADPFAGGNLFGQTINRCYNWRISGLCGGIKGTILNHYLNLTCQRSSPAPLSPNISIQPSRVAQ
jgi:hypothetical protein